MYPDPSSPAAVQDPVQVARHGVLTIRLNAARNLSLPPTLPYTIQEALASASGHAGSSGNSNRESIQRKHCWWLPYVVLGFDNNEIMVDALGGTVSDPVWMYAAHFDVSRASHISAALYLRNIPTSPDPQAQTHVMEQSDIYLGSVLIAPDLDNPSNHNGWLRLHTEAGEGSGEIGMSVEYAPFRKQRPLSMESFELMKVVGKGTFGKVMQVRKRDTSRIYAMKTIRKAHIASRNEITHTLAERTVLAKINNPFIVPLKFSFQSEAKLYLVLSFVNGGELFMHLQREGRFSEDRSRFYAAELLCALEHLHAFNVIYRDLKPENILLDYTGHIALCDFGLCKLNMTDSETTNTFCGTPEYLSPELLLGQGYSKTVDWWTLGVLLYEMLTGLPPFFHENTDTMYRRILQDPLRFPDEIGADARSILTGLLTREAAQRLGVRGAESIKTHPFFARHIDWLRLMQKKIQPPFRPSVESAIDTSNFDQVFTSEIPLDSVVEDHNLSETVQQQFAGFSYDGNQAGAVHGGYGASVNGGHNMSMSMSGVQGGPRSIVG
ncbi:AGC/Akt protein kinase [Clavulina sp. PMI_390]|nr:AGC/Akt protein kinase [Clavulina sp. PMI_390]